ncbi:MAG: hypothetical protein ACTSU4_14985 [Promethearchaeota archaeon]
MILSSWLSLHVIKKLNGTHLPSFWLLKKRLLILKTSRAKDNQEGEKKACFLIS